MQLALLRSRSRRFMPCSAYAYTSRSHPAYSCPYRRVLVLLSFPLPLFLPSDIWRSVIGGPAETVGQLRITVPSIKLPIARGRHNHTSGPSKQWTGAQFRWIRATSSWFTGRLHNDIKDNEVHSGHSARLCRQP